MRCSVIVVESLRKEMWDVAVDDGDNKEMWDAVDDAYGHDGAAEIGAATRDAANWVPIAKANTPDSTAEPTMPFSITLRVCLSCSCVVCNIRVGACCDG